MVTHDRIQMRRRDDPEGVAAAPERGQDLVIGRAHPGGDVLQGGQLTHHVQPRVATPVPAATLDAFRAPTPGSPLRPHFQALRRFHSLHPDSERPGTPLPAPKDG